MSYKRFSKLMRKLSGRAEVMVRSRVSLASASSKFPVLTRLLASAS